ncbi:hypothetical protein LEP1GSC021_3141 [Leptospira noguchii str. 1993005606]|nr:hypothetical protein LEP1GSC021_3141 [Leptospira noguchii str. 1993005606]
MVPTKLFQDQLGQTNDSLNEFRELHNRKNVLLNRIFLRIYPNPERKRAVSFIQLYSLSFFDN